MTEIDKLPSGVAVLDEKGINQVLPAYGARGVPAADVADALAKDPRAFIAHAFRLTALQQRGLAGLPDADLGNVATQLADVVRSGAPGGIVLTRRTPGGSTPAPQAVCVKITIELPVPGLSRPVIIVIQF